MTDAPIPPPPDAPPGVKVQPRDWRLSGFVAVHKARFPDDDPTAHRAVKWYNDEPVARPTLAMAANVLQIRPACQDADPEAGYVEMTPLYAASRGAVWCREPQCFQDVDDDA